MASTADGKRWLVDNTVRKQSYSVIAHREGVTRGVVASAIARYKDTLPAPEPETPFAAPTFVVLPKPEKLQTDADAWKERLHALAAREQYVKVAHLCDIHFPDHNEAALNLAYRLIARRQPHVIVVGSDTADFSLISSFAPNPDYDEQVSDELDELRRYWIPHIDTLHSIAPNATLVYVLGNHEQRVLDHMANNAPKLRKTVERAWIDLIRCQGRVMWLGRTEEVEIGNLIVKHGDNTNEHAAKAMLERESYQASVMAGHIHRMTRYDRMGRRYPVSAITSGCLCQLQPHYLKRPPARKWTLGTAFATADMKGTDVWFDNVEFRQSAQGLVALDAADVLQQAA